MDSKNSTKFAKFVVGKPTFETTKKNVDNQLELIRIGRPAPKQNRKWQLFKERVQALKNSLTSEIMILKTIG